MISLINRLKKRKGFTIIELVVVMAIMGVILAMVLPNIFTSDKPAKGDTLSKEFFYKTQDAMSISKIAYPEAFGISMNLVFYAEIDEKGSVTATGEFNRVGKEFKPYDGTLDDDKDKMFNRFDECAKLYFSGTEGMSGIVMALVDSNFTVKSCYWFGMTSAEYSALSDYVFDDSNVISGYYAGSYPGLLTSKDTAVFG